MSSPELLRVAITQRVAEGAHEERRDALDQRWTPWMERHGLLPLPVPNVLTDPGGWLDALRVEALLLSGGNTPAAAANPAPADAARERDALEQVLLEAALERELPVLGVCRGAQMMQLLCGGRIVRLPEEGLHVATRHRLIAEEGIALPEATVNSYHAWGLPPHALAWGLAPLARSEDGHVEAFRHRSRPWLGVFWHPERPGNEPFELDRWLVDALHGRLPALPPERIPA